MCNLYKKEVLMNYISLVLLTFFAATPFLEAKVVKRVEYREEDTLGEKVKRAARKVARFCAPKFF